jgi:hypothetical protein
MIYTVEILYAVAGIVVIVAALQIGIKMNYHEGDINTWYWACCRIANRYKDELP